MARQSPLARLAVIGSAAVITLPLAATSAQAVAGSKSQQQIVVTTSSASASASRDAATAAACNRYNRTQVCQVTNVRVTVLRNGRPVGYLTGRITQAIVFNVKSRNFREYTTFKTTNIVGAAGGIRETLGVSCGNPCKAKNTFPRGKVLRRGATIKGGIAYSDGVKKGKVHHTASRYSMTFVKPGYTPGRASWKSIGYRCDHKLGNYPAGCVIPRFVPTMTTMKRLPNIRANIRRIQNAGPGHWGRPGSGHPLHRMMNKKQQDKNRRDVCGRRVTGPPPRPGVSCDEYPFASTKEGGKFLSPRDRGWAWVPKGEQDSQRGLIVQGHNVNRVLDGEAFYVGV